MGMPVTQEKAWRFNRMPQMLSDFKKQEIRRVLWVTM
jgi:hypothetical protein